MVQPKLLSEDKHKFQKLLRVGRVLAEDRGGFLMPSWASQAFRIRSHVHSGGLGKLRHIEENHIYMEPTDILNEKLPI